MSQAVVTKRFQGLLAETDAPVHEDCPPWGQLGGAHGRQPCLWDSPLSPHPLHVLGVRSLHLFRRALPRGHILYLAILLPRDADSPLLEVTWLKMLRSVKRIESFSRAPGNLP